MRVAVVSILAVTAVSVLACHSAQQTPTPTPAPTTAQAPAPNPAATQGQPGAMGGPGRPTRPRPSPAQMDSMRRGMVEKVLGEIAGRENEPAGQVFKNVKIWKTLPARALLDTMNSYGRALGTTCTGCHIANQWDSENRKNKGIAREMQQMVTDLNANYLAKMPELDEDHPPVTCAMCHQGSGHPHKDVALTAAPAPMRAP